MLSGVYLTNDHVVQPEEKPQRAQEETLAEEDQRLRERIRALEQGKK